MAGNLERMEGNIESRKKEEETWGKEKMKGRQADREERRKNKKMQTVNTEKEQKEGVGIEEV